MDPTSSSVSLCHHLVEGDTFRRLDNHPPTFEQDIDGISCSPLDLLMLWVRDLKAAFLVLEVAWALLASETVWEY